MTSYLKMGFNIIRIPRSWIGRIFYNLSNKVKSKGFLASLIGTLDDDNAWIIDNGASRHMTRESVKIHTLSKEPSSHALELGDNNNYAVKGMGSTSLKLKNRENIHLNNILYVPGSKKNLLSFSFLCDKGERVAFVYGKFLVLGKDSSIDKAKVIGVHEGRLYRVITLSPQALVYMEINPIEI